MPTGNALSVCIAAAEQNFPIKWSLGDLEPSLVWHVASPSPANIFERSRQGACRGQYGRRGADIVMDPLLDRRLASVLDCKFPKCTIRELYASRKCDCKN